jgi:hypothetical protein
MQRGEHANSTKVDSVVGAICVLLSLAIVEDYVVRAVVAGAVMTALLYRQLAEKLNRRVIVTASPSRSEAQTVRTEQRRASLKEAADIPHGSFARNPARSL